MEYTVEGLRELKEGVVHEDFALPLLDIEQAIKEMDAEDEERLLLAARSYLKMTDEEFAERIDYFASVGEAIIKEEEENY